MSPFAKQVLLCILSSYAGQTEYVADWLSCCEQGVYTPSIIQDRTIQAYKIGVGNTTGTMIGSMNTTLYNFRAASAANELTRLSPQDWSALNATLATVGRNNSNLINSKVSQTGPLPAMPHSTSASCGIAQCLRAKGLQSFEHLIIGAYLHIHVCSYIFQCIPYCKMLLIIAHP